MLRIDFTTQPTKDLHAHIEHLYPTDEAVTSLLRHADLERAEFPLRSTIGLAWQDYLIALDGADRLATLLDAILGDPASASIHDAVRAFREAPPSAQALSQTDARPAVELLTATLRPHLGDEAAVVARRLVDRLAREGMSSGDLFDATRAAIEFQLLTAEELTPTLIMRIAYSDDHIPELAAMIESRVWEIKVPENKFFARTLDRVDDWHRYFIAVTDSSKAAPGTTLCRIRTGGFVAPQFLVGGLLSHFDEDWRPIIDKYAPQLADESPFAGFQASLWNTWLMWGPSIPLCDCDQWKGIRAFQAGYGDENSSMPVVGLDGDQLVSFESAPGFAVGVHPTGAVFRKLKGKLRWGPTFLRDALAPPAPPESGELPIAALVRAPSARTQRQIYTDLTSEDPGVVATTPYGLVFQADRVDNGDKPDREYFSAYLWLMFLVARSGDPPRRLRDEFPPADANRPDRMAKHLWRDLVPIYVHANIADAGALEMQRAALVANALGVLRMLWSEPDLLRGVSRDELRFYLVGSSDYTGCGTAPVFRSSNLLDRLRTALANQPAELRDAIVVPQHATDVPHPTLVRMYATCNLPDLVDDYFSYLHHL